MNSNQKEEDLRYMRIALALAEEAFRIQEVPVGALIVRNGEILSRAYNKKEQTFDPLGHAEILAIRDAAECLQNWRLIDSVLYVTKEPCIMCCGAILHARIKRVVYGCRDEKGGAAETLYQLLNDPRLNHRVEVVSGVCEDECAELLRRFFSHKRAS